MVLDIKLPRLDGWQVLGRLKTDPATAAVPVVVASVCRRPTACARAGRRLRTCASRSGVPSCLPHCDASAFSARAGWSSRGGFCDGLTAATVLAVDDEPVNLRLLDAVLSPRGHRVITVPSGPEALAVLENEEVDLVLLDIVMPDMDGHTASAELILAPIR